MKRCIILCIYDIYILEDKMKEVINYLTYRIKTEKFLFCGWCLYSYIWLNIFKNSSEMGAVIGAFTGLLSYERKNNIIRMEKICLYQIKVEKLL